MTYVKTVWVDDSAPAVSAANLNHMEQGIYDAHEMIAAFSGAPTGTVVMFGASAAPSGWLLCDGSQVLRTTYAALDALIGTTYGAYTNGSGGAGTTHLRLPDLRGRVAVGRNNTGGTFLNLGAAGGEETHVLSTGEMPAHNHGVNDPGHTHGSPDSVFVASQGSGITTAATGGVGHGSAVVTSGAGTGISIQNAGSGGAHNNLQPYLVLAYIIKT